MRTYDVAVRRPDRFDLQANKLRLQLFDTTSVKPIFNPRFYTSRAAKQKCVRQGKCFTEPTISIQLLAYAGADAA